MEKTMNQKDEFAEFLETPSPGREYLTIVREPDAFEKGLIAAKWVIVPIVGLGKLIYDAAKKYGLPDVALVRPNVADKLNFPSGGAVNNVLYRRHPYVDTTYIQAAEFNPYLFKDKISELARVMIAAGATSFDIAADTTKAEEIALDAGTTLEKQFGGSFRSSRKSAMKIDWSYTGAGKRSSALPDNLVWYNHEPQWDVIWNAAVHSGAKRLKLQVSHDLAHEIDANLAAKFQGAGFQLGGKLREVGSSKLSIDVTFGG
jgi:hypothetical protein